MDGILNIAKPSGTTSFSVVSCVKRLSGDRRVGHGGTLDPLASGVLPVFLGQATRVVEYLMEYSKTYRAEITLGVTTASYDAEGEVLSRCDASYVTLAQIESLLPRFIGDIMQKPPVFSALKRGGRPLYELARKGAAIEIEARQVTIYRLDVVCFAFPRLILDVECSKGTYIRSLAHDFGEVLGCGAHLSGLVRTAYGPFDIKNAVTLEKLEESTADGTIPELLQPLDAVLTLWDRVSLTASQVEGVRCGVWLPLEGCGDKMRLLGYDDSGKLVTLLTLDAEKNLWRPGKVFC
ncbi:MAG: tRNA pseudouridine(55) synthase TruB [Dehalococcoidia bacterium]|nr:tRNA pseudouridine(55) synthase TruB [Dehalococcoidia bacterium]